MDEEVCASRLLGAVGRSRYFSRFMRVETLILKLRGGMPLPARALGKGTWVAVVARITTIHCWDGGMSQMLGKAVHQRRDMQR